MNCPSRASNASAPEPAASGVEMAKSRGVATRCSSNQVIRVTELAEWRAKAWLKPNPHNLRTDLVGSEMREAPKGVYVELHGIGERLGGLQQRRTGLDFRSRGLRQDLVSGSLEAVARLAYFLEQVAVEIFLRRFHAGYIAISRPPYV